MIVSTRPISFADVTDHYDELDAFYRDLWGDHVHHGLWQTGRETSEEAVDTMARLVAKQAKIATGDRVLDIGSGYGAVARLLAREFGARVTAITISPAQYHYASGSDPTTNPKYLLGDWLTTEFLPESFDAAVRLRVRNTCRIQKDFSGELLRCSPQAEDSWCARGWPRKAWIGGKGVGSWNPSAAKGEFRTCSALQS